MHKSVLLQEVIGGLGLKDGATVLDGTFGAGGHSAEVLKRFPDARIIALDADNGAIARGQEKFGGKISFHNSNFRNLDQVLKQAGVERVDGIILDLGLSSDQLSPPAGGFGRGFSFMKDEPLLMTFGSNGNMKENPSPEVLTAADVVNDWEEVNLEKIIRGYGEERFARKIARGIAERRKLGRIKTTADLVEVIENSVPGSYKRGRMHCATKTFQAIRIAVNDELGALSEGLKKGFEVLKSDGRMAVISFHSLEDRIVKRFYREKVKEGRAIFPPKADQPRAEIRKPITASKEEIMINPRARSAKLRIIQKK